MRNSSKTLFGLALVSSALAGCGGSSGSDARTSGVANVVGGAAMITKTATSTIPAGSDPVSADFGGVPATVPAGIAVASGSNVAIVSTSQPVLGLQGSGTFTVNGGATGLSLTNGKLSSAVALPPSGSTPYAIVANAPASGFTIPGNATSRAETGLTIKGRFELGIPVLPSGIAGFPIGFSGTVPTNGSNASSIALTVSYNQAFAGYKATLRVAWQGQEGTGSLTQTKTVGADGKVTFTKVGTLSIPASGVAVIGLSLAPNVG